MTDSQHLPVRPMNDAETLLNYPRVNPLDYAGHISRDAALLLSRFGKRAINFDIFDPKAKPPRPRYGTTGTIFTPTPRILAAIQELVDARLAYYDHRNNEHLLNAPSLHREYTVAHGRGSSFIRVSTFTESADDAELLAVLIGADLETQDSRHNRMPQLMVRARHENGTDIEHDSSSTALFTIQNPTMPVFTGYGGMELQGTLSSARFYHLGFNPLSADDGETVPGEHCTECTPPHPFVAYQPSECSTIDYPVYVKVEVLPLRPYLVAGNEQPSQKEKS